MRTTADLDADVLMAAKEIARQRGVSLRKVLSELARQAMTRGAEGANRDGIPLFPVRADSGAVTLALVNQLRDEAE
jgi:hypothetical protein